MKHALVVEVRDLNLTLRHTLSLGLVDYGKDGQGWSTGTQMGDAELLDFRRWPDADLILRMDGSYRTRLRDGLLEFCTSSADAVRWMDFTHGGRWLKYSPAAFCKGSCFHEPVKKGSLCGRVGG